MSGCNHSDYCSSVVLRANIRQKRTLRSAVSRYKIKIVFLFGLLLKFFDNSYADTNVTR